MRRREIEDAAGPEHARDLTERGRFAVPWKVLEHLPAYDRVERLAVERQVGRACHLESSTAACEMSPHGLEVALRGLDTCDRTGSAFEREELEPAESAADVEHVPILDVSAIDERPGPRKPAVEIVCRSFVDEIPHLAERTPRRHGPDRHSGDAAASLTSLRSRTSRASFAAPQPRARRHGRPRGESPPPASPVGAVPGSRRAARDSRRARYSCRAQRSPAARSCRAM